MASDNDNDMKVEPDVHDFADDPAHAAQDSTLSVSATPPPQLYRIKSETESPAKPVPSELATRRSTRVRRVTVKQELLGSSTTLPVSDIKREVVKKVVKAKGKAKAKRGDAPPEQYAHLQLLPEYLKEDLDSESIGNERKHLNEPHLSIRKSCSVVSSTPFLFAFVYTLTILTGQQSCSAFR